MQDADLEAIVADCLTASAAVMNAMDVRIARDALARVGDGLRRAHVRCSQILSSSAT